MHYTIKAANATDTDQTVRVRRLRVILTSVLSLWHTEAFSFDMAHIFIHKIQILGNFNLRFLSLSYFVNKPRLWNMLYEVDCHKARKKT